MSRWIVEQHRSTRWLRSFAWKPVKTFDCGWIWLRFYRRWQCVSGWNHFDDYPYKVRTGR